MAKNSLIKTDKLTKLASKKGLPLGACDMVKNIAEMYTEYRKTKVEIEQIRAQREILIEDIKQRYALYNKVFDEIFFERRIAINKMFEVIDRGIATGNDQMIESGLQNLANVVATSPFSNFASFAQALQTNQPLSLE